VIFPEGPEDGNLANIRAVSLGFVHAEGRSTLTPTLSQWERGRERQDSEGGHRLRTAARARDRVPGAGVDAGREDERYDVLLFCGFSFDPEARALIQKTPVKRADRRVCQRRSGRAHWRLAEDRPGQPDIHAYGEPDVKVTKDKDDTYVVELAGVDIYDPLTGKADSSPGEDAAAWFLDTDYDGMTFHICQAFFPGDKDAWDKLQRALRAQIEPEAFEQMRGTKSFPFQPVSTSGLR